MKTVSLGPATEIVEFDITKATEHDYASVLEVFNKHSLVVIREQEHNNPWYWARLVEGLGNNGIECLYLLNSWVDQFVDNPWFGGVQIQPSQCTADLPYPIQRVTGARDQWGKQRGAFPAGMLGWHNDLSSPNHPNAICLQAHHPNGTSTSFINTVQAYNDLSREMKDRCSKVIGEYVYSPEIFAKGNDDEFLHKTRKHCVQLNNGKSVFEVPLVQTYHGQTGLYFNFNNRVKFRSDPELVDLLKKHIVQSKYTYQHWWKPGDIVIACQLLTLHKRDQNGDAMLERRDIHRYTFNH